MSTEQTVATFAGIVIKPGLTRVNYFFLFFNTFLIGMFMSIPAIVQPAFMLDIIHINPAFAGSINAFLQNMSQIATLAFVALVGALSDKTGRRILIVCGFCLLFVSLYLFQISAGIADVLGIPPAAAARICAVLSFAPGQAAEFTAFAPGLLVAYCMRFLVGLGLILVYPQFITMVGDYSSSDDRGRAMALNGMSLGFAAMIVVIFFGMIMQRSGVAAALTTAMLLAAAGSILSAFFLRDWVPDTTPAKKGMRHVLPLLKSERSLQASYLCALITRADITVMATFLVTWGVNAGIAMGMDSGTATARAVLPLMIITATSLVAYPLIGLMLDRQGRMTTLLLSVALAAGAMLLLALAPSPFSRLCYAAAVLAGFGIAGTVISSNTLALDSAPAGMMGSVMGGLITMQPLGVLVFLGLGGYLFDSIGPSASFALKAAASFALFVWLLAIRKNITGKLKT